MAYDVYSINGQPFNVSVMNVSAMNVSHAGGGHCLVVCGTRPARML